MSQRRTFTRRAFIGLAILVALATPRVTPADTAIPLLSGFDRERIDNAYPPTDEASLGELAKLVYRLRSLDPSTLKGLADDESGSTLGDAINTDGSVEAIITLPVPSKLVEFLEFSASDFDRCSGSTADDATHYREPTGWTTGGRSRFSSRRRG